MTSSMTSPRSMLGMRIRNLRIKRGYSQKEFARVAGINLGNYGRLERGQANVSFDLLVVIAQTLEVSCSELTDYDHTKPRSEVVSDINRLLANASEDEIQLYFRLLSAIVY